jgi:hypothetical protein
MSSYQFTQCLSVRFIPVPYRPLWYIRFQKTILLGRNLGLACDHIHPEKQVMYA